MGLVTGPTEIQSLAIPTLLAGQSALLAAETGSGKTLAFLAPIAQRLLAEAAAAAAQKREQEGEQEGELEGELEGGEVEEGEIGGGRARWEERGPQVLVLAPNATLCRQIAAVGRELVKGTGLNCKRHLSASGQLAAAANSSTARLDGPPPAVDILVGSPAAMTAGRKMSLGRVGCVVLDEGDLLLRDGRPPPLSPPSAPCAAPAACPEAAAPNLDSHAPSAVRTLPAVATGYVKDVDKILRAVGNQSGAPPQLVLAGASIWPGGASGTAWSKAVRPPPPLCHLPHRSVPSPQCPSSHPQRSPSRPPALHPASSSGLLFSLQEHHARSR